MKILVIIPTYNERENIDPLVKALARERKLISSSASVHANFTSDKKAKEDKPKHVLEVLFVDDTSPDKTYEVIRKWQKKHKWVHLLLNEKKVGLGGAYAKGIKHAVEKLRADAFVEMDSDFQHDPADVKRLVAALDEGADYVIGSRYVKGGSIPKDWEFSRKFLSVVGNLVARVLLLQPKLHDVTTGFKLTRVKGFYDKLSLKIQERRSLVNLRSYSREYNNKFLISTSFAYKIQLLHEMVLARAKVVEVPIEFHPRNTGESKIIKNELFETLMVIFLLQVRNPKIGQFVKFGMVGFLGYIVQAVSLQILTWLSAPEWLIWGGSAEAAIISNFTWNNMWTFKERKISGRGRLLTKFWHFNVTSGGAILIQIIAGSMLVYLFGPHRQIYLPLIIGFLIVPYNYLIYTRFIWRKYNEKN